MRDAMRSPGDIQNLLENTYPSGQHLHSLHPISNDAQSSMSVKVFGTGLDSTSAGIASSAMKSFQELKDSLNDTQSGVAFNSRRMPDISNIKMDNESTADVTYDC